MATVERREACPKCQKTGNDSSKDNLAIYTDNHAYCYRCGYYIPAPRTLTRLKERILSPMANATTKSKSICLDMPADVSSRLSPLAINWLKPYNLYPEELGQFLWSESEQQLIYPVRDKYNNLVMWQGRNFGDQYKTKYYTVGEVKHVFDIQGKVPPLVLVEDRVSAIKVARICGSMPLLSGHIHRDTLIHMKEHVYFGKLIFWLDPDKAGDAMRLAKTARMVGFTAHTVLASRDPKEYSTEEIRGLINHFGECSL